jgi:hypothetical protein
LSALRCFKELDSKRVDSPAEREKVLIRHLAAAQLYNYFSYSYQLIFGSQLDLLQALNAASPVPKETIKISTTHQQSQGGPNSMPTPNSTIGWVFLSSGN